MTLPAKKMATYDDLFRLPANMTGEIIEGGIHAFPRPHYRHASATIVLGSKLLPPYRFGEGGPGGWIILIEPEIMLGENLLVPDLAGWRRERLPAPPEINWTNVSPDWAGEILSPGTTRHDRVRKMPIYARHEVGHLWLIDPLMKTLESYRNEGGRWVLLGAWAENDKVRVEPFEGLELDLGQLWWGD